MSVGMGGEALRDAPKLATPALQKVILLWLFVAAAEVADEDSFCTAIGLACDGKRFRNITPVFSTYIYKIAHLQKDWEPPE